MKQLRIVIIVFILLTAGAFLWLTAGTDARTLLFERIMAGDERMVYLVLLISVLTLLSTLTGLPVFYLSMAMGFLLDFTPALLICWVVNLLSVLASFFMVRSAFSDYFRTKYGKKKLIRRINKRIENYGLWSVVFSRGIYILPTNLINFSFPLSNITIRSYLAGTTIGLIPECLINVLTGFLIKHEVILLSSPETRSWQAAITGTFILLLLLVFFLLKIRQNRRKKFRTLKGIPFEN
ncbi:MAG: VTT domain-containing protein [Bacteroidales bacterium]|nr:VTT domain-containing protein [Bacteroidales bacterium]